MRHNLLALYMYWAFTSKVNAIQSDDVHHACREGDDDTVAAALLESPQFARQWSLMSPVLQKRVAKGNLGKRTRIAILMSLEEDRDYILDEGLGSIQDLHIELFRSEQKMLKMETVKSMYYTYYLEDHFKKKVNEVVDLELSGESTMDNRMSIEEFMEWYIAWQAAPKPES